MIMNLYACTCFYNFVYLYLHKKLASLIKIYIRCLFTEQIFVLISVHCLLPANYIFSPTAELYSAHVLCSYRIKKPKCLPTRRFLYLKCWNLHRYTFWHENGIPSSKLTCNFCCKRIDKLLHRWVMSKPMLRKPTTLVHTSSEVQILC